MSTAGERWLSFHVFLQDALESFLLGYLLPAVDRELAAGRLKRFFFIRYSEGGLHLRLRFLPARTMDATATGNWLREIVREFDAEKAPDSKPTLVQEQRYNRAELYFGETLDSVYAELLNEQTSYLSLLLLHAQGRSHGRLLVVLSCTLYLLLRSATGNTNDFVKSLKDSQDFAARTLGELGLPLNRVSSDFEDKLLRSLNRALPVVAQQLEREPSLSRISRLLRRTGRSGSSDGFVGTHALHLLCNKTGFALQDEYHLFGALRRLTDSTSPCHTGKGD